VIFRPFTTAILAATCLCSSAFGDYIFTDDGAAVYRFSSSGGSSTTFSNVPGTGVKGMAVTNFDPVGVTTVLAAAGGNNAIYAYSQSGVQSVFANNTNTNDIGANLTGVIGIAVDPSGDVFVGANSGTEIQEFGPTGAFDATIVTSGLNVNSLAINAAGQLFEADNTSHQINEYTVSSGGTLINSSVYADLSATGNAQFYGMAFDTTGNLYVSYWSGPNTGGIYEIAPGGGTLTSSTVPFYSGSGKPAALSYNADLGTLYMSYVVGSTNAGGLDVFSPNSTPGTGLNATPVNLSTSLDHPYGLVAATPEPGTWLLFAGGILSLILFRKYFAPTPKAEAASRR
jgi:sugar lactone lactonase YvrE